MPKKGKIIVPEHVRGMTAQERRDALKDLPNEGRLEGEWNHLTLPNGKRVCGQPTRFPRGGREAGAPCMREAGLGTDHLGAGKCYRHGGKSGRPISLTDGTQLKVDPSRYFFGEKRKPIQSPKKVAADQLRTADAMMELIRRAIIGYIDQCSELKVAPDPDVVDKLTTSVMKVEGIRTRAVDTKLSIDKVGGSTRVMIEFDGPGEMNGKTLAIVGHESSSAEEDEDI